MEQVFAAGRDVLHVALLGLVQLSPALAQQELGKAEDGIERGAELVAHRRQEAGLGLAFPPSLFRLPALRNIHRDATDRYDPAVLDHRQEPDVEVSAIEVGHQLARRAVERRFDRRQELGLRGQQLLGRAADQSLGALAEALQGPACRQSDRAVVGDREEGHRCRADDLVELSLALPACSEQPQVLELDQELTDQAEGGDPDRDREGDLVEAAAADQHRQTEGDGKPEGEVGHQHPGHTDGLRLGGARQRAGAKRPESDEQEAAQPARVEQAAMVSAGRGQVGKGRVRDGQAGHAQPDQGQGGAVLAPEAGQDHHHQREEDDVGDGVGDADQLRQHRQRAVRKDRLEHQLPADEEEAQGDQEAVGDGARPLGPGCDGAGEDQQTGDAEGDRGEEADVGGGREGDANAQAHLVDRPDGLARGPGEGGQAEQSPSRPRAALAAAGRNRASDGGQVSTHRLADVVDRSGRGRAGDRGLDHGQQEDSGQQAGDCGGPEEAARGMGVVADVLDRAEDGSHSVPDCNSRCRRSASTSKS